MLNHIVLQGRLTKDPELRYTQSNTPVCSFTIACDRDYGNDKKTDFINCVAWRQGGEFISKYFSKGNMICVSGRLELRDYTDRDGNKRTAAEINVEHGFFCEKKAEAKPQERTEVKDDGELPF